MINQDLFSRSFTAKIPYLCKKTRRMAADMERELKM